MGEWIPTSTDKYSRCPACGRKSVYLKLQPYGEDIMVCRYSKSFKPTVRYCPFYFYLDGNAADDRENEARWRAVNSRLGASGEAVVGDPVPHQ